MADQKRLQELFDKYVRRTCTPEEVHELVSLLQDADSNEMLDQPMRRLWNQMRKELMEYPVDWQKMYDRITGVPDQKNRPKRIGLRRPLAIAATVAGIIALSFAGYLWYKNAGVQQAATTSQVVQNDVLPGGNKATLTLANGSTVILNQAAKGVLATQGRSKIVLQDSGRLVYEVEDKSASAAPPGYNTLTTPRGGQYRIRLPDGTDVWLNAASSIKYPTSFQGNERKVAITGEAYFEVAANASHPFIVMVNDLQIKVLGTHFNVNAYSDESSIKTTLLEGRITVQTAGGKSLMVAPGQQVQLKKDGKLILVNNVDMEEELAWKNGLFVFHQDDLNSIMRRLSRWYNVQVEYEKGQVPESHFTGAIRRQENLSKVLNMLELTGGAKFKISGDKIIVSG
ncbi:MAG: DUF4974 domain-containing protein [Thermoflavifilum aggregans]|nr:DUF4974 domain-containing protein [Thermoflavifilum aggregans]